MPDTEQRTASLLDFIAGMTTDDFGREIREIRRERARLAQLEKLLIAASEVARVGVIGSREIDAINTAADAAVPHESGEGDDGYRSEHHGPGGSPNRKIVAAILREDPDRIWTPLAMFEELKRRGFDAKQASVRVMLQRLFKEGLAQRASQGRYRASPTADDGLLQGLGAEGDEE